MDNTTKHTPGPWKAVQHPREHKWAWTIEGADGVVQSIARMGLVDDAQAVAANAHLIAAAPAMYEALKDLLGELGDLHDGSISELQCHWCGRCYYDLPSGSLCTSDDCPGYKARAALAQAEGHQHE